MGGTRVTEGVWPFAGRVDTEALESCSYDSPKAAMPEGPTRSVQSQEDFLIVGLRTDFADIASYRVCE